MFFSGTGTTEKIVTAVADGIARSSDQFCRVRDIDFTPPGAREQVYRFAPEDILVFGVPVIAGRVPNVLLPFLNTLEGGGAIAIPVVLYGNRDFDDALIEEEMILNDESLTIPEQLTAIIGRVPERYTQNDLSQLYVLKEKYPSVYKHWKFCRENYWEGVALLLERGIKEGSIRPVSMPILKTMFQATVEQFFQKDVLVKNHIPYREALSQVADILVNGIIVK